MKIALVGEIKMRNINVEQSRESSKESSKESVLTIVVQSKARRVSCRKVDRGTGTQATKGALGCCL